MTEKHEVIKTWNETQLAFKITDIVWHDKAEHGFNQMELIIDKTVPSNTQFGSYILPCMADEDYSFTYLIQRMKQGWMMTFDAKNHI